MLWIVDYENGMGISVGRLREDTVYDYKFVGLSHNTIRGAARRCDSLRRVIDRKRIYSGKIIELHIVQE